MTSNLRCFLLIFFFLVLFIMAGCESQPTYSIQPTYTTLPTYTPVVPTPVPEPTLSPTPDLRFWVLLPQTLEMCFEQNVIQWETRDIDLATLMEKVEAQPSSMTILQIEEFPLFHSDLYEKTVKEEYSQTIRLSWLDEEQGVLFEACAALRMPDGEKIAVFILPVRRSDSLVLDRIAIAVDTNRIDPGLTWDQLYDAIKNRTCGFIYIPVLLKHQGKPWGYPRKQYLISLIPEDPKEAEEYFQNLKRYFDPDTYLSSEDWNELRTYVGGRILPVVGFSCNIMTE